ncbi:MAG: Coenzyme gamma-F420-2:L-glutamate ligase [Microgenomates group bacterium Gr01-1014_5]|nr:MAG: Coenzyme gamma-F420-2:L-glutamate ligase [Microgenomates group bacterium Gr01-1014_5]
MRIHIFSKSTEHYAPGRITEEAHLLGHSAENLFYKDLVVGITNKVRVLMHGKSLEMPSAVVLRVSGAGLVGPLFAYQRVALINYYSKSIPVMNRETYISWIRLNKLEQHYDMVRSGIPVVPSVSFSSEEVIDWDKLEFPLIAKTSFGSSGQGVFKIENKDELLTKVKEKGISNYLFQKMLTTRQDYRVIVIGGKALPKVMKKTAQEGEFLTNFARGGAVQGVPLNSQMQDLAERTAKVFKADYAGIDIMYDTEGNPYVLEINRGAQFQGFEESTGINVAREIVQYLERQTRLSK